MRANTQLALALDPEEPPLDLAWFRDRLRAVHGPQHDAERLDPITQLVLAILSARTRDEVALAALHRLWRRYGSWEGLADAAPREIETTILPVTHADTKARQLPRALRMIKARCGRLDLGFLVDLSTPLAMRWLMGLPGVGMRNAATVLNFSTLRGRTFSVDTHILRLGHRLRLLPAGADIARGFETFMRLIPAEWDADDLYELHWLMKLHGQHTCTHDAPDCPGCPLRDLCFPPPSGARPDCRTTEAPLLSGA